MLINKYLVFTCIIITFLSCIVLSLILDNAQYTSLSYLHERNNSWQYYGNKSLKSKLYELKRNDIAWHRNFVENTNESNSNLYQKLQSLGNNSDQEIQRFNAEKQTIYEEALYYDTLYTTAKHNIFFVQLCLLISQLSICLLIANYFIQISKYLYIPPTIIAIITMIIGFIIV